MGAVLLSKPQLVSQPEPPQPGAFAARLAELRARGCNPEAEHQPPAPVLPVPDGPGTLQDAWGDLLSPRPWDWFFTGTFRRDVSRECVDAAWARFASWVRRRQGWRSEWVRVLEPQQSGRLHVHALMAKCGSVRRLSAVDYWRGEFGFATCAAYDPALGAGHYLAKCYVAKGVLKRQLDVSFSRRFASLAVGRGSQPDKLFNGGAALCNPSAAQDTA